MRPVSRLSTCSALTISFSATSMLGGMAGALQQQARQEAVAAGGGKSQSDGARFAAGDAPCRQRGAFGQAQDAARFQQEDAARRGQLHRAAGAVQQLHAQHMLQKLDLPRQRRLGHVHAPRRGRNAIPRPPRQSSEADAVRIEPRRMRPPWAHPSRKAARLKPALSPRSAFSGARTGRD